MVRFLHTADWQLGMTRHFLAGEAQARFSEARIKAVETIGKLAVEQGCSFVVVSGDVFETNHVERRVIVRALDAMGKTPNVTFYLLPGNHDPLNASSIFTSRTFTDRRPDNVVVLDRSRAVDVASGVRLIAAPWTSVAPLEDLVQRAISDAPQHDGISIVVGHGVVDTLNPDPTNTAAICLADLETAIDAGGVHYVALGDRHSTTSVGDTGKVHYSGAPEPTGYREIDPGNVLIVEIDDDTVTVETHPVGTWTFHTLDFDLQSANDVDLLVSSLSDIENKRESIVQLKLVGQLTLGNKIRFDLALESEADLFASLNTWERHNNLVVLPDDEDFTQLGLSGFANDALNELTTLAQGNGEEAHVAQDALGLLYRLVESGS